MESLEMVYKQKNECCGCTACENICPKNAITMQADSEGFLYPVIDQNDCINCNLCVNICSFSKKKLNDSNINILEVYAAKNINDEVRLSSSSGGVFTAISDYILEKNGIVFGALINEKMEVVHQKVTTKKERDKLRGSKYVQSNLRGVFRDVKSLLKDGNTILFTGTPCQIDGLKGYLKNQDTSRLLLCDIVCHGVPSPLIFKEYIDFIQKKTNNTLIDYKCRDKSNGWHIHTEKAIFLNGKEDNTSSFLRIYKNLFYSHNILRPACHNCKYTNLNRSSDLTISDFWGIEKSMPDFDDNKGISLLLINSEKGRKCFEDIIENIEYRISNTKDCLQPQLIKPTEASIERENFWKDYNKFGFKYISNKYGSNDFISKVKRKVRKTILCIRKNNVD